MATQSSPISPHKFSCLFCNITCAKKTEWTRHINTRKHKINETGENSDKKSTNFVCKCGKIYKDRSGLWRHEKKCNYQEQKEEFSLEDKIYPPDIAFFTNLVMEVVKNNAELQKQNQDFQKQMLELYKTTSTSVSNTNTNHSYNKTFNLQFFLNEQCKDAMNIMEFVDSMTLELSDLEEVGKLGYVEGISNIIIRNLNAMDIYKRPIHCSDGKREIMYVKDDNVWEKKVAPTTASAKPLKE